VEDITRVDRRSALCPLGATPRRFDQGAKSFEDGGNCTHFVAQRTDAAVRWLDPWDCLLWVTPDAGELGTYVRLKKVKRLECDRSRVKPDDLTQFECLLGSGIARPSALISYDLLDEQPLNDRRISVYPPR
jgi:hypothetical protein